MTEVQALGVQFVFGLAYNEVIRRGFLRDLVSLQVVVGTLVVLVLAAHVTDVGLTRLFVAGVPLTNAQHAAWFVFQQLAAAGLPMVLGSLWRHWQRW